MASIAVDLALSKLDRLAINEANLQLGLDDHIKHIKRILEFLRVFLEDADQKRRDRQNKMLQVWLEQLREVTYDLEDMFDEYALKLDLRRMKLSGWRASLWFHSTMQLIDSHRVASQIRKISGTLEKIASDKDMFLGAIDLASFSQDSPTDAMIKTLRTEVEEEPIGQYTYVEKLIPQMLKSNAQRLVVIPIFGMGGLGKTTLAKRLYNHRDVRYHFHCHAWLTISHTFNYNDLYIDLLRRLMKELKVEGDTINEDKMKRKLKDHLYEKSFIIVLDDLWEIDSWMYLKAIFPIEHQGITVLLTTRNKNIAINVNPDAEPFELQPLEPEESWGLFCKKAFADANCPENFQVFKRAVIERSKRLPLAIVILGGLLRNINDPNKWKKLLNQSRWEEHEMLSILYLSYDYLPIHLKKCFLYVAGCPEDRDIDAKDMMRMWIAEGFIRQQEGQTMEDLAEKYLEELIQWSLLKLWKRDAIGHVAIIQVHDIILDMARKEAEEINFLHQNTSILTRRLSLCDESDDDYNIRRHFDYQHNYPVPKLRSLRIQCPRSRNKITTTYIDFHSTKYLRVLSIQGIQFQNGKCPKALDNLIQLRYLCFANTNLNELTRSISNLQNLQTLDVTETKVSQLPNKFWEIASLRHVIGGEGLNVNPPSKQDINELNELQTLVGCPNYKWIIKGGLQKLTNIRTLLMNKLSIANTDLVKVEEKVLGAIENLKHLTTLCLGWELASMKVLTAGNTSLQFLLMLGNRKREIVELGSSILQPSLPNLHMLVLSGMFLKDDEIDTIGLLPNLKSLYIMHDTGFSKLVFKEGFFSCIKQLALIHCTNLTSWEIELPNSTTMLERVRIDNCPELKYLPQGLQVKEIHLGNDDADSLLDEVRLWAERMTESKTKTLVTFHRLCSKGANGVEQLMKDIDGLW